MRYFTGTNNGFPFFDILGYLKNTHKNPKFGKVRQVPTREFPTKFPDSDLSQAQFRRRASAVPNIIVIWFDCSTADVVPESNQIQDSLMLRNNFSPNFPWESNLAKIH